ncbi:MAG: response regulator [Acidimicrobiales bacterium]
MPILGDGGGDGALSLLDVAALEQQLEDLAVLGDDAAAVLTRLAEAIFPGGAAMGDPARLLWPERSRAAATAAMAGMAATRRAVDPRELLEAQIRQSEARFRSLVEQLPAVVFYAALGDEENEVYVSPHIEALLGFTQQEWLTNPLLWYSQLHPDDHDTVIDAFTKGMQTGSPFQAEVRFFSRDGEEVWILGEARLIRDERGRPAYFQGVAFDITMAKRAQEVIAAVERAKADSAQQRAEAFASHNVRLRQLNRELRAARDEAEAAAEARSTFLTTMSHELRTPLNSIIVLAGLLADETLTAGQQDMVRQLGLSSDHLLALINDVLDMSRLRAGQVELEGDAFDLLDWLDHTLEIVAPHAAEKGLELRLTVSRPVPEWLVADRGRVRQVLVNLLGNAVKFTARGFVEVRVGGRPLEDGRWEIECAVVDTGMGIRPEDALTLFDEFRQADTGISREFGGTGLGLAICKRLCDLLGGRIWVEASGGPGSTVAFTWVAPAQGRTLVAAGTRVKAATLGTGRPDASTSAPVAGPTPPAPAPAPARAATAAPPVVSAPPAAPAAPGSAARLRILVAEDNQMNQQVALLLLRAMGHQADLVSNGDEAIAAVQAKTYDVVLMDIAMPGTDGLSATRAIRALGDGVHQPHIVALTAHAFPGDEDACLNAGMDDYVTKPIDRARLADALTAAAAAQAGVRDGSGTGSAGESRLPPPAGPVPATPPTTPTATRPTADHDFDPSLARSIQEEFGSDALLMLVGIFRTEASRLLGAASAAVSAGDAKTVETAVHTLKSGAANLGARGLYDNCNRLETMARGHSLNGAEAITAAMARQLASALRELDMMLSQVSTTS